MSNGSPMNLGLLLVYCRHIRRHIGVTSNIPGICRGFSFAVLFGLLLLLMLPHPSNAGQTVSAQPLLLCQCTAFAGAGMVFQDFSFLAPPPFGRRCFLNRVPPGGRKPRHILDNVWFLLFVCLLFSLLLVSSVVYVGLSE